MYWSPSSIPCQIYCAGHRVVLSNTLCCVTNYSNHRLNLGSLKLGSFLLGSLMQLKSDIPCTGWDCGYPKSWLSWMSQTTHSYSWQVILHCWLGAQLGVSTWVASYMWPHYEAWLPHSKVDSKWPGFYMRAGFLCSKSFKGQEIKAVSILGPRPWIRYSITLSLDKVSKAVKTQGEEI